MDLRHYAPKWGRLNTASADDWQTAFDALALENAKSVAYRYREEAQPVAGRVSVVKAPVVAALKAIASYEYQSCEHPGWEESEVRKVMEQLRAALVAKLSYHPSLVVRSARRKVA